MEERQEADHAKNESIKKTAPIASILALAAFLGLKSYLITVNFDEI